jgi:hypothetical protein
MRKDWTLGMARPELYPVKKVIGFDQDMLDAIDKWRRKQIPITSASEAIRRLVETALAGTPRVERRQKATREAFEMADQQIDRIGDPSATSEERESRKQRLLKGPKEFRDMRAAKVASRRTPKR